MVNIYDYSEYYFMAHLNSFEEKQQHRILNLNQDKDVKDLSLGSTSVVSGTSYYQSGTEYESTSTEEKLDRKNEMKARATLLMALPNKDQMKFHSYQDAKLLMEAIEKSQGDSPQRSLKMGPRTTSPVDLEELVTSERLPLRMLDCLKIELEGMIRDTKQKKSILSNYASDGMKVNVFDVVTNVTSNDVKTVESNHELVDKSVFNIVEANAVRMNNSSAPIIKDWNSDDEKINDTTARERAVVSENKGKGLMLLRPQHAGFGKPKIVDQSHIRKSKGKVLNLNEYEDYDGGFVSFRDGKGRIFGKGKQHKASCKAKLVNSISKPLHMLHMDLFGPTNVKSLMKKSYCLVVTDDFSRFSWVFFLATKDETSGILKTFITEIENQLDHKVKVIRCDNGTEFKNSVMNQFCEMKGIKREFSVARTPQQNGVAERRNRTLIEAARTMLVDSKLPTTFWAEAVNTACYVLNRVLVIKPHNKTPYELIHRRTPLIDFIKPFGCPVTILNTRDHLGKFDGKADEGFFVGYSVVSKAMRVFNKRTRIVEETLNIRFLENTPNVTGNGPDWLFDVDSLTISMNYMPVVSEEDAKERPTKMDENGASDKDGKDDQATRSEFERLLQQSKKDERGICVRNNARLVAQGYTQRKSTNHDVRECLFYMKDEEECEDSSTLNGAYKALLKDVKGEILKGHPKWAFGYPRDSPGLTWIAFSDSDYVWKLQTIVANFTTEAEYVAAGKIAVWTSVLDPKSNAWIMGSDFCTPKIFIDMKAPFVL
ncbi:putative ribonuclease H-like domain-containing protein [Tanacetum coccineum]